MSSISAERSSLAAQLREGWAALKGFLFPGKAEKDPGFKEEIRRRSVRGLYIVAGVTAIMPVLGVLFHILADLYDPMPMASPLFTIALLALAGATLTAALTSWGRRHARPLAFLEGGGVATIMIWSNLLGLRAPNVDPVLSSLIDIVIVLVVALTAIPARPMQMFVFGWGIAWINYVSSVLAARWDLIPQPSLHYYAAFDLVILLCVVLAGLNYQLLWRSYLAHLDRLTSNSRLISSEMAVSFSRLSATLSHELNSPLGALSSSIESLRSLEIKEQSSSPLAPEKARQIRDSLFESAEKAVETLTNVSSRIQRFTNLDRAETTSVHIDKLLLDIVHMVGPGEGEGVKIELTAAVLPVVEIKPQAISGVFSRLIQNAIQANIDGQPVEVKAVSSNGDILVTVRDHGEGLSNQAMQELFEPSFRTRGNRIGASNWGLFTARQIVREHGGEISVERAEGGGTTVTVQLPLDGPAA